MKRLIAFAALLALAACSSDQAPAPAQADAAPTSAAPAAVSFSPDVVVMGDLPFESRVLTTGLRGPWEITWGPDGYLWVTERIGKRIIRINPADGSKETAIQIDEVEAPAVPLAGDLVAIARDPGALMDDRRARAGEAVDERGLADVRIADDRHLGALHDAS